MDVYILMNGDYHEEVPVGVFSTVEAAQAALDAEALEHPHQDPFVESWTLDGDQMVCDLRMSPAVVAERERRKAEDRAAMSQRKMQVGV